MPEMMYHRGSCHYYEERFRDLCVCDNSLPPEAVILAGKNGTHFFFTKTKKSISASKSHGSPKSDTVSPTIRVRTVTTFLMSEFSNLVEKYDLF